MDVKILKRSIFSALCLTFLLSMTATTFADDATINHSVGLGDYWWGTSASVSCVYDVDTKTVDIGSSSATASAWIIPPYSYYPQIDSETVTSTYVEAWAAGHYSYYLGDHDAYSWCWAAPAEDPQKGGVADYY